MKERVKQSVPHPRHRMDIDGEQLLEQLKCSRCVPAVLPMHILDSCLVTLRLILCSLLTFPPQFTCSLLTGFCVAGILPTWRGTKTRGCSNATCSDVILPPLPSPRVSTKSAPRSVPSASPPVHEKKAVRSSCDDDDDDDGINVLQMCLVLS